ncbi:c-type cytochrome [Zooshikella harenae]|uniref:Cytochrome c n=1 Tax=Zooshikella harenae TaxID=2827238 RepID=A0ABS5ZEY5_9GAMM|nr:cytochrome c [Zooshikella harenae]MBU2711856.1 cytochrome c [Zooshikella harenae]
MSVLLRKFFLVFFLPLFSLSSMYASAAGDIDAGKNKAKICTACHGEDGHAKIPIYPHLAGQNAAYLESALKAYRAKQRQGGQAVVMHAQAANLSDQDIADLAAFYNSLK